MPELKVGDKIVNARGAVLTVADISRQGYCDWCTLVCDHCGASQGVWMEDLDIEGFRRLEEDKR